MSLREEFGRGLAMLTGRIDLEFYNELSSEGRPPTELK
jgi:hypothetical protein